ncbi:hypothetical protein HD806DRAFT_480418 [Xylariaceae sp. AK1471]|nr:hypothetical protein HD806DRAFT_480418 [Xylariaceae sp. AK1471]
MSKRTTFTTISPLPAGIPREVVIEFLHNHQEMIDLNPLIIERHPIPPPPHAQDEESRCVWWSMTDKISYLPGGLVSGEIEYTAAFNDLPNGVQTHCYAPMNIDIRERWSLGGTLPGEPFEPVEIGLGAPRQGLYLREDVELRCNFIVASFVKKTLKKAHGDLVERLCQKAAVASSRTPSPNTNVNNAPPYNESISSHTKSGGTNEKSDIRIASGTYMADPSRNRYTSEQAYPQHLHPLPSQYENKSGSHGDTRHHDTGPRVSSGSAKSWAGAPSYDHAHGYYRQAPAELQ